ncbi:MAG: hypothetical protein PQJ61_17730 [Spirochaetales bacterium]|uniref:Uncharacterized protein n=1 Tax=Candidatus Thalassospirochaeta sargassi TaxID=3119039 RepID=A0AAJ1IFX9_9SPIO|nr:hypothetical protein [Spirochaetales bacterium]
MLNLLGGFGLASETMVERISGFRAFSDFFEGRTKLKIIVGILSFVVGILKLLSSMDVTVAGDLLPALCNIAVGIALTLDYYKDRSENGSSERLNDFFARNGSFIGIVAVIFGLIHFFIPRVLLL